MGLNTVKKGDAIRCIDPAPEACGLERRTYRVQSVFVGPQDNSEACIEGMEKTVGVTLVELPGRFRLDRFVKEQV